jgi:hypothetical protein
MLKTILAATALLLSGIAAARPVDTFDAHCADIVLLQAKPIQKELGLTEAQRNRMNKHAANHRSQLAALEKQIKAQKPPPPQRQTQLQLLKFYNELKVNVLGELSAAQVRRLREISLQRIGIAALCDPYVAKKIGMSEAQLKKMQDVYSEGVGKFSSLEQATMKKVLDPYKGRTAKTKEEAQKLDAEVRAKLEAAKKDVMPQMTQIRNKYNAQMKAILTSSQRATFAALQGKTFKV